MATPSAVNVTPDDVGLVAPPRPITREAAAAVTELLQRNHDLHHIFFNNSGFHNHIAHHMLAIYSLGAGPEALQRHYDSNAGYQRPQLPVDQSLAKDLADPMTFSAHLAQRDHYHEYLVHFQNELASKGVDAVLTEYLFSGTERADDLFSRLFAGVLHPIIHLGYGVEFHQPAIVAEALAETAVHDNLFTDFLLASERAARSRGATSRTLVSLLDEARGNPKLRSAAKYKHENKWREGVFATAFDDIVELARQWTVGEDEVPKKAAELINFAAYFTGAAQRPDKAVKFDFFHMHALNSTLLTHALLTHPGLDIKTKCRIIEWKGRVDLTVYVSRGCAELRLDDIRGYSSPRRSDNSSGNSTGVLDQWPELVRRVLEVDDDGHTAKFLRALMHGERVCGEFERRGDADGFRLEHADWLKLGNMLLDSAETSSQAMVELWVRSAGFDEAWKDVSVRAKQVG